MLFCCFMQFVACFFSFSWAVVASTGGGELMLRATSLRWHSTVDRYRVQVPQAVGTVLTEHRSLDVVGGVLGGSRSLRLAWRGSCTLHLAVSTWPRRLALARLTPVEGAMQHQGPQRDCPLHIHQFRWRESILRAACCVLRAFLVPCSSTSSRLPGYVPTDTSLPVPVQEGIQ